jgi:hypothetical protein
MKMIEQDTQQRTPGIERIAHEWRSLIDSLTEPVSVHDEEFRIIRANRAFADLVGYDLRELTGKRCYEVFHGKTCPPDYCPITRRRPRSRPVSREVYDEDIDRYFNITVAPLRDGSDSGTRFVHIINDITERKKAELALKASEKRLQSIIDNTSAVIYLKDIDGRYILINRQYEKLFGVKKKEVVGMTDYDIFPADRADRFRENDLEVAKAGRPMQFDETVPQRDGLHHYISVKFPLFDSDGRVSAVCGISTDITERKAAEAELEKRVKERTRELSQAVVILSDEIDARRKTESALKRSELKYKSMFEGSPVPLLEVDLSEVTAYLERLKRRRVKDIRKYIRRHPEFLQKVLNMLKLVDVNAAMVELYGANDRHDCLHNFKAVFCEESLPLLTEQVVAFFEGRKEMEFEGVTRKFNGELNHVSIKWSAPLDARNPYSRVMISVIDITERKRLEAALNDSIELYRARFEESPISLWDKDYSGIKKFIDELRSKGVRDFRKHFKEHPEDLAHCATLIKVTDINKATVEMYGAKDKEDFKKNLTKIFCDETWNCFLHEVLYVADRRSARKSETVTKKFNGERNNILVRWTLPKEFPRDYSRMLFSIMDITERKRVENALRESERRFRAAATSTADLLWEGDIRTDSLVWFGDIDSMLGYKHGRFPRTLSGHMTHVHPDDRKWMKKELEQAITTGRDFYVRYRIRHKNGSYRYWEERGKAVEFEKGKAVKWVGSVTDITDRVMAESALQESEQLYRTTFENAGIGIAHLDMRGSFLLANEKLCEIVGMSMEEIREVNILDLIHPDDRDGCRLEVASLVSGERPRISCEKRFISDDGRVVWTHSTVTPFRNRDGGIRHLIMLVEDITERKKMEEEARAIQSRLIHTNKMTALGTLVSGVVHEINNPNSYIMSNAEIFSGIWKDACKIIESVEKKNGPLSLGGLDFSEVRRLVPTLLDGIKKGSERIKAIVGNLKSFSSPEPVELTDEVDINNVVRTAMTFLKPEIKKHSASIGTRFKRGLPPVKGNSKRLEQVVVNLVMNAMQAVTSRNDGRVDVTTSFDDDSGCVEIRVKDNGCGIHESILDRVTEPFFTTKIDSGGTGLGLSISYAIVNDHAGMLNIHSKQGRGTTVSVRIPAVGNVQD